MQTLRRVTILARLGQAALLVLLLGSMLVTSACGGDPQVQQQASQSKTELDGALKHASDIGVPPTLLQPIIQQEQQLTSTGSPFSLFNEQSATLYYRNLTSRYTQLKIQTEGITASATEQLHTQAQQDLQTFQNTLSQYQKQGLPVQNFSKLLTNYQTQLALARLPKEYSNLSASARTATQSLNLMKIASERLKTLKDVINWMQNAHLDVGALQGQYQADQQALANATLPSQFINLNALIDAQYQQAVVHSTQALPYVTEAKLNDFAQQIKLLQSYGMDASAYQKKLDADRQALKKTMTMQEFADFAKKVDADIASMRMDLLKGQARYLVQQFHQRVDSWGRSHMYHNKYDGRDYILNSGYTLAGIGSDLDQELAWAQSAEDFQAVINDANDAIFNHQMLEQDYNNKTPYNQPHASDLQLLEHYKVMKGQVIVVSLVGQALRLYQDGKLVRAFLVTTGRYERPSLPGFWTTQSRESPTIFKSNEPKNSPYWYPDTPIHYAILYRWGGYFIHDSWWRVDYGPGTQFPHYDSGGDQFFAGNGSHGCVNVQEEQAAWLYQNTNWQTKIIIY
ncbi:MAG: L,D-transpeptidase [Ktedonobacteraceae bacterium]|nr:L,D-transpeptidase [Ktedonobacteraceae bacterium]